MGKEGSELTGSGRGRTVVVVVSDGEAGCNEPDYQEADYGELDLLLWKEEKERTGPDELDENPSFRTMLVLDGRKEAWMSSVLQG